MVRLCGKDEIGGLFIVGFLSNKQLPEEGYTIKKYGLVT
jgi:hypothetical protein